jgi:hypothetical protein
MSETVNQEQATINEQSEKTFSQAELDAIIGDRLKRERDKYSDYEALKEKATRFDEIEEASKTELQKATERAKKLQSELDQMKRADEIRTVREKVANEYGVPINLLSGESEEICTEQAKAILEFKQSTPYPQIKDGGEIQNTVKGSTRQQFADWANAINS